MFYDAFQGQMIFLSVDQDASSGKMAALANLLGAVLVFNLIFLNKDKSQFSTNNKLHKYLLLFLGISLVSVIFSINISNSVAEAKRLPVFLLLYFVTISHLKTKEDFFNLVQVFYGSLVAIFILSLYKFSIGEIYGTLGKFIFILAPVVLLVTHKTDFRVKLRNPKLHYLVLLSTSILMLISESRRIFLGITFIWLSAYLKNTLSLIKIIPFAVIVLFFAENYNEGQNRYNSTFDILKEISSTGTNESNLRNLTSNRNILWESSINAIQDNIFFGGGIGNAAEILGEYGDSDQRAHNFILDTALQIGILGLFILVLLIIESIKQLRKISTELYIQSPFMSIFSKSILIGFIASLILAFFGGNFLFEKWGWLQLGIINALILFSRSTKSIKPRIPYANK